MFQSDLQQRDSGIEWPLWLAVSGLMLLGAAFIFSATGNADLASTRPFWRYTAVMQIIANGASAAVPVRSIRPARALALV